MAHDIIQVNYEQLGKIASTLDDRSDQLKTIFRELQSYTDHVLHNNRGWIGDNADAFSQEMEQEVYPALDRLWQSVATAGDTVRDISKLMRQAEEDAAESGISGNAPGGDSDSNTYKGLLNLLKTGVKTVFKPLWGNLATKIAGSLSPHIAHKFMDLLGKSDSMDSLSQMFKLQSTLSPVLQKVSKAVLGGTFGGVLDFAVGAMTGKNSWTDMGELGVQVTSGIAQAGIGMIPVVGQGIIIGNMVVQATGVIAELGVNAFGNYYGVNTDGVEKIIRDARELVSLDRLVDSGVRWVGEQGGQLIKDIGNFFRL